MQEHSSGEELDRSAAPEAPEDTASPPSANVAIPVNAEVAANVLSSDGASPALEGEAGE